MSSLFGIPSDFTVTSTFEVSTILLSIVAKVAVFSGVISTVAGRSPRAFDTSFPALTMASRVDSLIYSTFLSFCISVMTASSIESSKEVVSSSTSACSCAFLLPTISHVTSPPTNRTATAATITLTMTSLLLLRAFLPVYLLRLLFSIYPS